jgi:Ulp1 family protease
MGIGTQNKTISRFCHEKRRMRGNERQQSSRHNLEQMKRNDAALSSSNYRNNTVFSDDFSKASVGNEGRPELEQARRAKTRAFSSTERVERGVIQGTSALESG